MKGFLLKYFLEFYPKMSDRLLYSIPISFDFHGNVTKIRHRQNKRTGKNYNPNRDKERQCALVARSQWIHTMSIVYGVTRPQSFTGPLLIEMINYRPIPKSWSQEKRNKALGGELMVITKPDIDNTAKFVYDSIEKSGIYKNDQLVVSSFLLKTYHGQTTNKIDIMLHMFDQE